MSKLQKYKMNSFATTCWPLSKAFRPKRSSQSRASIYLGNIETGKSKKEFEPSLAVSERERRTTLHVFWGHPGREIGGILVPVHFFQSRRENRPHPEKVLMLR